MKKTLIAMFALAGMAMAADPVTNTVDLSDLMSTSDGIILNGLAKTEGAAIVNNTAFSTSFDTMSGAVSQLKKWYVNKNDANVGDTTADTKVSKGVSFVTDGPSSDTAGRWAAFAYELDAATLADIAAADSALTLTFNVSVTGGNNKKSQTIDFYLMTSASIFHPTDSYGNLASVDPNVMAPAKDITLTLSAANVAKLAATGTAQKLIFAMYDEEYTGGTNEYWTIQNAKLTYNTPAVPEPATATLSLLALAGLAARRRRH